jgi:3-hydroxymyristoyl/3-hydroxydecanoyl-(acyl carrier protein) dehydratase
MPGVLQIEALAQTGGILCINAMPPGEYDTYFLKIDNCKFKYKVVPGDTMILKMEFSILSAAGSAKCVEPYMSAIKSLPKQT